MNAAELAQDMEGSAVQWIKEKSADKNVDMVGSIIADDGGKFFNRLVWAKPDGEIFTYDKKHLVITSYSIHYTKLYDYHECR